MRPAICTHLFAPSVLMISFFAFSAKAAPPTAGFTGINVRNSVGTNTERLASEGDGSPSLAIDGNFSTATYLTTSNTVDLGQRVFLDLGTAKDIYGFRWNKVDAYVDPHTLSFLTSNTPTTTGLLNRTFTPVTGLTNGYFGTELVNGTFAANNITNENDGLGFYSVTFDRALSATAIRFDFLSGGPNDHYHVFELQAIVPEPASVTALAALGGTILLRRPKR